MTLVDDGLFQYGGMPVANALGLPFSSKSKYYFVDPASGSNDQDGLTPGTAMAGIEAAEDKTVANQHDAVVYIAGSSGNNLAAALTWDKNYTHLVGVGAETMTAQRTRIFQVSTLTGASPLLNITATGCIFSNFYIFQGVADATSLINVAVTGGRNHFRNVHFAGGGNATQAIDGGASLKLDGAEENTFDRCTIGVDTIDAATGMMGMLFDGEAHRNVFNNCIFRMRAGNSGAGFIEVVDSTGIDRDNTFNKCVFLNNSSSNDMDSAIVAPAGMGEPKVLMLHKCLFHNTTKLDANDRGIVFGDMDVVTPVDLSGQAKELIT